MNLATYLSIKNDIISKDKPLRLTMNDGVKLYGLFKSDNIEEGKIELDVKAYKNIEKRSFSCNMERIVNILIKHIQNIEYANFTEKIKEDLKNTKRFSNEYDLTLIATKSYEYLNFQHKKLFCETFEIKDNLMVITKNSDYEYLIIYEDLINIEPDLDILQYFIAKYLDMVISGYSKKNYKYCYTFLKQIISSYLKKDIPFLEKILDKERMKRDIYELNNDKYIKLSSNTINIFCYFTYLTRRDNDYHWEIVYKKPDFDITNYNFERDKYGCPIVDYSIVKETKTQKKNEWNFNYVFEPYEYDKLYEHTIGEKDEKILFACCPYEALVSFKITKINK